MPSGLSLDIILLNIYYIMSKCTPPPLDLGKFINIGVLQVGKRYYCTMGWSPQRRCFQYIHKVLINHKEGPTYNGRSERYNIRQTEISTGIDREYYLDKTLHRDFPVDYYEINEAKEQEMIKKEKERQNVITMAIYPAGRNVGKYEIRQFIGKNGGTRRKTRRNKHHCKRFKSSKRKTT